MNPEEREVLIKISNGFSLSLDPQLYPLPLVCYALDENYLPADEYKKVRDVDFSGTDLDCSSGSGYKPPKWFAAAVLVYIRNFFERSDGKECWNGYNIKCQQRFVQSVRMLRKHSLLPPTGTDIRQWLLSQCWVIRAENRGTTSGLIINNEKLLNSYIAQFGKLDDWNLPPAHLKEWRISSDLEAIPYVRELHTNHRWELLQSLFAISAEGEMPAELPRWLHPLWGLKRGEIQVESREPSTEKTKAEWMLRFFEDEISPGLQLPGGSVRTLLQGDLTYTPTRDFVYVSDMIKRGFNLEEQLKIRSGESFFELPPLLQSVDETCAMFSAPREGDRNLRFCGVMDGNSYKWRSRVCLLHRKESLELLCADTICDCLKTETIYNQDREPYFYISCYELPDVDEETFVLLPGIGSEINMSNRVQVYIENDSENKAYKDGAECIVVCSSTRTAYLSFSGAEMTYIDSEGTCCTEIKPRGCCIVGEEFYTPYKLSFVTRAGQMLEKTVLFVPDDFFQSSDYLDLSKPGKWRFEREGCLFEGSLIQPEWGWNDDTVQRCITVDAGAEPVLTIYRPYNSLIELRIGDRCISKDPALCAGKRLSEILAMFEDLQPKAKCELLINGKSAYTGPFNPAGSYIYKCGQEVRFYNEKRNGVVYIRHELYYKNYLDETIRSNYQKIFDAKREFRRALTTQNSVVIPPGLYNNNNWEPGYVIFEQGMERGVCFELPYTGAKSITERWGEINPKMCSLVALMMSYENAAIKNTRLYAEIEALPAIIVEHLPFAELANITRASILPALWDRAPRKDEDMTVLGYTKPAYCELSNCSCYNPARYVTCESTNHDLPCVQRMHSVSNPYYNEEERKKGISSILATCRAWVGNVAIDMGAEKKLFIDALRQMNRAGVLKEKEEMYLCAIIQTALQDKEWKIVLYLLSGILIGISENLEQRLGTIAEKLAQRIPADRIDVLSKFVMLVRWISKRYTK